ncbi:hypothetical protein I3271_03350 [Photobacterium leiognathi]|uniref:hypothetical protein n=1 Tax=Photobacterium leiognathi TaxID=553611 RepID=UPI001EDDAE24|nr:hypothetical protein [Photobacterium leiognathi]MCG3883717.1 hypothetical protein [Photobacterium leiognathi]
MPNDISNSIVPISTTKTIVSESNRQIVFQGMTHVGSEAFYNKVRKDIIKYKRQGFKVFYEGVTILTDSNLRPCSLTKNNTLIKQPSFLEHIDISTDINIDKDYTAKHLYHKANCSPYSIVDIRTKYRTSKIRDYFASQVESEKDMNLLKHALKSTGNIYILFGEDHQENFISELLTKGKDAKLIKSSLSVSI